VTEILVPDGKAALPLDPPTPAKTETGSAPAAEDQSTRVTPRLAPAAALPSTSTAARFSAPAPPAAKPRTIVEPLSEHRYRLQLNASTELKRKLELARDLVSHANPSGDLAVVVERALDLLIDKLERDRFARTDRPRPKDSPNPNKRRIPNATRRQVVERDGLQCSYVSPDGERCPSRQFLQFDHERAWALGGKSTPENSRILCAAHNQFMAEQDFGREHVTHAIQRRTGEADTAERSNPRHEHTQASPSKATNQSEPFTPASPRLGRPPCPDERTEVAPTTSLSRMSP
jgi:5-methylcytosine-specific restriction endonuclease McrA